MNKRRVSSIALVITFFLLAISFGVKAYAEAGPVKIPAKSLFSKLSVGMSQQQVIDLIGNPKEKEKFVPPKAYNPFYFGPDREHTLLHYKGQGRLEFDNGSILVEIMYDPKESGYANGN